MEESKNLQARQVLDWINDCNLIPIEEQLFKKCEVLQWADIFNHIETEVKFSQCCYLANTIDVLDQIMRRIYAL